MANRAQSRGLRPGSSVTLRDGFAGLLLCVGGGARVEVPGCRSYWCGWRFGTGPRAGTLRLLPEVLVRLLRTGGRGGGRIAPSAGAGAARAGAEGWGGGEGAERVGRAAGIFWASVARAIAADEAGGEDESVNEGISPSRFIEGVALGVVCGDALAAVPLLSCSDTGFVGRAGGGIAALSAVVRDTVAGADIVGGSSSLVSIALDSSSPILVSACVGRRVVGCC